MDNLKKRKANLISKFYTKIPNSIISSIKKEVRFLDISNVPYIILDLSELDDIINSIIILGNIRDLSDSASIGLIAHLFGLIQTGYSSLNIVPTGSEWLKADLEADDIAKEWGFEEEIFNLRKIRPQKLPEEVIYDSYIIPQSVPNKYFERATNNFFNKIEDKKIIKKLKSSAAILFCNRFSLAYTIGNIKNEKKYLGLFSNNKYNQLDFNSLVASFYAEIYLKENSNSQIKENLLISWGFNEEIDNYKKLQL